MKPVHFVLPALKTTESSSTKIPAFYRRSDKRFYGVDGNAAFSAGQTGSENARFNLFPELKRYPDLTAEKLVTGESGLDDYYMSRGLSVFEDYKQGKMSEEEYVLAYEKVSATDPSPEEVIGFLARSEIREDPDNNIFRLLTLFAGGDHYVRYREKSRRRF